MQLYFFRIFPRLFKCPKQPSLKKSFFLPVSFLLTVYFDTYFIHVRSMMKTTGNNDSMTIITVSSHASPETRHIKSHYVVPCDRWFGNRSVPYHYRSIFARSNCKIIASNSHCDSRVHGKLY